MFQKMGMGYNLPLERLTVQAPIRSASITDTLDFARLQMGHLTFIGGDLNAHSPLWDTSQPSDTRGGQLEDLVIAHSASVLNDVSLANPSLAY